MEFFHRHILEHAHLQAWIISIATVLLGIALHVFLHRDDGERPVPFTVPIPEQSKPGWQGEILETPSIQVYRKRI
jgi:hypothetical protein